MLLVLFAAPAADAKAPPQGVQLCGAGGTCVAVAWQDAERMPVWHTDGSVAPGAPAPYYVVRYRWGAGQPEQRMYWLPSRGLVRESTQSLVRWFSVAPSSLQEFTVGLAPIAVPKVTHVTIAGRAVRAPGSYLRLFAVGRATDVFPAVTWARVRIAADARSPWTEPNADVRISTSGAYLLRDDVVFAIPKRIAERARRGLSLAG